MLTNKKLSKRAILRHVDTFRINTDSGESHFYHLFKLPGGDGIESCNATGEMYYYTKNQGNYFLGYARNKREFVNYLHENITLAPVFRGRVQYSVDDQFI